MLKNLIFLSLIILFFTSCSTKTRPEYKPQKHSTSKTKVLYAEYLNWVGTPYKYGGITKSGIDCSGFIQAVYKTAFNIKLPRTTLEQVKVGRKVNRNHLKIGDLVFFRTGKNTRHTGILIEKDKFMHSSSSKGVLVSSLHNPYWKSKYWQTRRVLR